MDIPESLARKMAIFAQTGRVFREQDELFSEIAWQQVFIGQGLLPKDYHPLVDALSMEQLRDLMQNLKDIMAVTSARLPSHQSFLDSCSGLDR
jgi:tryptophan halogenase